MLTIEFKNHKLCNSTYAQAFIYPSITNGHDMMEDVVKMEKKIDIKTMLNLYVAFRMGGDVEARSKSVEEIVNEVEIKDTTELTKLVDVVNKLLSEKSKKD